MTVLTVDGSPGLERGPEVFETRDPVTGERVRIEVVDGRGPALDLHARVARTCRATGGVDHASVRPVLAHAVDGGRVHLVTAVPRGRPLDTVAVDDEDIALEILRAVADALAAAHHRGVVHGDLRTGDVHVGADGTAELTGFGRAEALGLSTSAADDIRALADVARAVSGPGGPGARLRPRLASLRGTGTVTARAVGNALTGPARVSVRRPGRPGEPGLIAALPVVGRVLLGILAAGVIVGAMWSAGVLDRDSPRAVAVPDLVGVDLQAAEAQASDLGLGVRFVRQQSAEVAAGRVVSQEPLAGATVDAGGTITVVVSAGGAATAVPEVVGLGVAAARAALLETGLSLQLSPTTPAPGAADVVTSQATPAGDPSREGDTVVVVLGPP